MSKPDQFPFGERVTFDDRGKLDEIVTLGRGAFLERMDRRRWFLSMECEDGSSIAVWIEGEVNSWERRDA